MPGFELDSRAFALVEPDVDGAEIAGGNRFPAEIKAADSTQNSAGATIKWSGREMIQAHPVTEYLLGRQGCRV